MTGTILIKMSKQPCKINLCDNKIFLMFYSANLNQILFVKWFRDNATKNTGDV